MYKSRKGVAFLQDMRPTYSLGNGDDEPPRVVMPSFWTGQTKAAQEKRRIVSEHPVIQHMIFELVRAQVYAYVSV